MNNREVKGSEIQSKVGERTDFHKKNKGHLPDMLFDVSIKPSLIVQRYIIVTYLIKFGLLSGQIQKIR